ncbi:hypothetical protein BH09ACT7_BH09ACT7_25230 [soil metagenome]
MTSDWQGPINQLLYGLTFTREITDEVVAGFADAAVNYTGLGLGPEVYYRAIQEALASGTDPVGANQLPQLEHAEVIGYLRALAARLEELRPWPEPNFRRLDVSNWSAFERAVPIARLDASMLVVRNTLKTSFDPIGNSQPGSYVLMLRLRTGETVALRGTYDRGDKVTLLADATGDPAEVIEHFVSATGFPEEKVIRNS